MANSGFQAIAPDQGEHVWFMGGRTTIKADDALGVVAEHTCARDFATPLHVQPEDDEAFYVLFGRVTFEVAGQRLVAEPGAYVHIPAGAPHAFRVDSDEARLLNLTTAQHGRFFRQAGEPVTAASEHAAPAPDMARVMAAALACNVEVVGPPLT